MKKNVGENIRNLRLSYNLTQAQFGASIGVSASCIQHWEANYTEPDLTALRKIKEIYNVMYEEIID